MTTIRFDQRCTLTLLVLLLTLAWGLLSPLPANASEEAGHRPEWEPFNLSEPRVADLEDMRERKQIRALVSYSKTDFFVWKGQPRGFETELLQRYEEFLNAGVEREDQKVRIVYIPVPFEELLPALTQGLGDIAAAGLTVTDERRQLVDFTDPYLPEIDEVVVTSPNTEPVRSRLELAGRRVHVISGSSRAQRLRALSTGLKLRGFPSIDIVEVDDGLTDADVLELVNAGVFEMTVVDSHVADVWATVFDEMVVQHDVKLNYDGRIAWAVRKNNPELRAHLNSYLEQARKGTQLGNILFSRYFENDYFVKNPLTEEVWRRLHRYTPLFKRYSDQYHLDWFAVAAQAYQESGFNHDRVSDQGAVGLMQLLPSTAADPIVGIADIDSVENNVHAAVRYLAFLREQYYSSPEIPEADRWGFMWAAYNAGPGRVQRMRQRAAEIGLDPNRWFDNVEHAAQQVAGAETVRHVANVHKYYVAYRLSEDLLARRTTELTELGVLAN